MHLRTDGDGVVLFRRRLDLGADVRDSVKPVPASRSFHAVAENTGRLEITSIHRLKQQHDIFVPISQKSRDERGDFRINSNGNGRLVRLKRGSR